MTGILLLYDYCILKYSVMSDKYDTIGYLDTAEHTGYTRRYIHLKSI